MVVWRKDLYTAEGERQLNDGESYQVLNSDNTDENNRIVEEFIKAEIDQDRLPPEAKVLIQRKPRCSIFYMLPKIHKVGNPGRPIVSTCNCPTELISSYGDDVLQPIVSQLPSFCKDSTDALYKLDRQAFNAGSYLFTMDVKSLYTVIPHSEGLFALRYFLDKRSEKFPPTETVVRLAELVLTINTLEFNDKFYTQTRGVAMGTKMGPSFANIFLGYIENKFFETYTGMKPTYLCYIDDIFGLADMTFVDIQKFIDAFCRFHPAVQFTFDIGKKVSFLDISVSVESENLVTTVYYKPTDSHSYLHYKSNHSRACKDAIPYSQFLRLRRLCSKDYPLAVVSKCLEKAKNTSRNDLLHNDTSSKLANHKLPLILDFNSYNCKVMSIVKNNFFVFLCEDEDIGKMFENNIVCSYSNERSLSKYLVRSKLTFDNETWYL